MNFDVNYLVVVGAAVAGAALNAAWYSGVFAGVTKSLRAADLNIAGRDPMPPLYGLALAAQLLMAFTLAVFIKSTGMAGLVNGMIVGGLAWLGFTATVLAVVHSFAYRRPAFIALDAGNWLVTLLVTGAILGQFG